MDRNNRDQYNFDYFDQMNQKEAARQQARQKERAKNAPAPKQAKRQPKAKKKKPPKKQPAQKAAPEARKTQERRKAKSSPSPQPKQKRQPKPPVTADPLPKKPKRFLTPEERKKVQRRRKVLAVMGGSFAVLLAVMVLSLTVFFKIDTIEVTGASRYSAEQIIKASGIETGAQNLFTLNEGKTETSIMTALPYVGTVSISRHLPGTVVMEVSDITVVGAVQRENGYVVIGTNGRMLELVEKLPENCPLLKGANLTKMELGETIEYENEEQAATLDAFAAALQDGEIDKITEIDITDLYSVKATYDDRILLKFGMPTDLEFKIRFAAAVLNSGEITDTQKGTLDLSLAVDKNRGYFDADYSLDTSSKNDDDDSDSGDGEDGDSGDDSGSDDSDDDGIPDDYELDDDGYYYGEGGYYDAQGNFYEY